MCTSCSKCSVGEYTSMACSDFDDTHCSGTINIHHIISYPLILSLINKFNYSIVCSDCPASSYIQSACGGTQNTVCKTCTTCTGLTYELQPCVRGLDAVCASCKICTFPSAYVGQVCEAAGWFWWYLSNCCYDESGSLVSFF